VVKGGGVVKAEMAQVVRCGRLRNACMPSLCAWCVCARVCRAYRIFYATTPDGGEVRGRDGLSTLVSTGSRCANNNGELWERIGCGHWTLIIRYP
jgi:hypothetical protein